MTVGSPPHLRGKQFVSYTLNVDSRITPAPAGKTGTDPMSEPSKWDHPRTCGENLLAASLSVVIAGSPPHLRGKLVFRTFPRDSLRITPAPAGKTAPRPSPPPEEPDHPRTCGENRRQPKTTTTRCGSPPHLRGKLPAQHSGRLYLRITPAPAGKTRPHSQILTG